MDKERYRPIHFSQSARIGTFILLFVFLLVLYTSLFQMVQQSRAVRRDRIKSLQAEFERMCETTDEQINALVRLAATAHSSQVLRKVSRQEYTIVDEMNAQQELDKLSAPNQMLNKSYYYVRNTQVLFTSTGMYRFPESERYFLPFEGIDAAQMQQILSGQYDEKGIYLLPSCRSEANSVENVIVAVLPLPYRSDMPYATVLVEICEDKLLRLVLPSFIGEHPIFRFYREDGTLLLAANDEALSLQQAQEPYDLYVNDVGERLYCFRAAAQGRVRLTYEMYVPERTLLADVLSDRQVIVIVVVGVLLLLLLCPVLYVWTYQPMRLLVQKLVGTQERSPGKLFREDYAVALREIEQLKVHNNSLLWKIDESMNLVRASLIRSLLEYSQTSKEMLDLCERADLTFQHPCFRLVLVMGREAHPSLDSRQYIHLLHEEADVYIVNAPHMLYVLLNTERQGTLSSRSLVQALSEAGVTGRIEQLYFAGSAWTTDPTNLHVQYRQTLDKLSQKLFHDDHGISEEAGTEHESGSQPYPVNEMMQLRESALDQNYEGIVKAVTAIQHYLLHRSTKSTVAVLAATDVLNILQRSVDADMSPLLEQIHQKDVIAAEVCQTLSESLAMLEKSVPRQSADTLTEEMMLYISEMLESPNLSSAAVSAHFGMSESAFSHAFKKRMGGNTFSKYVTDLKIQRAKSLLICTELSVEEIADKLNYASASSFARMFKAETSLTPTQYRKLSHSNPGNA